jgi:DNA-binding LacI/PurR family transcriptional regulator
MVKKRTGKIAYIGDAVREVAFSRYWSELVGGLQEQAFVNNFQVEFFPYTVDLDLDLADKVDGFIIGLSESNFRLFEPMLPKYRPNVSIIVPFPQRSSVLVDDFAGGKTAMDHLIGLGHRRIAIVVDLENPHNTIGLHRRMSGWKESLDRHSLAFDQRFVIDPKVPNIDAGGSKDVFYYQGITLARDWFKAIPKRHGITAIVAQNDSLAMGMVEGFQSQGISVPGDISVIGFDGLEDFGEAALTTIETPIREMGSGSVLALTDQIIDFERERPIVVKETLLSVKLRQGRTTGQAPD